MFSGNVPRLSKGQFFRTSLEKVYCPEFFTDVILDSNPVTLLNGFMIYLFLVTFQIFNKKAEIPLLLKLNILDFCL